MAGLREKQKADRQSRILEAALLKFRSNGYRAVHIEDLAEQAGVSVGTVYNYYVTKGEILIACVTLEVEEVLLVGQDVVNDPPKGSKAALLELIFCYYDHSLKYLTKEMWRTAMSLAVTSADTPIGQRYNELDKRLAQQVGALVSALQQRGEVRADINAEMLGELLFNNLNVMFMDFAKYEKMSLETLKAKVEKHIDLVSTLIENINSQVRF